MPKRKLPPNEEVIEMYESGMSCGEIAEKCGVAPVTVQSLLDRIGHPKRSGKEAARIAREKNRIPVSRYWKGKKQPAEMVELRASKIRGENHYLWKGGNARRPYRDIVEKTKCGICSSKENLGIHHIDFNHFNNDPNNLQVMCVNCHMSLHKQAYWDAIHSDKEPPKSNGPIGWRKEGGIEDEL